MSVPDDLRALGIDRAELRWEAVCGYLDDLRDKSKRATNRAAILALASGFATESAALRGEPGWVSRGDILSTVARIRSVYGDQAADIVLEAFIPVSIRG